MTAPNAPSAALATAWMAEQPDRATAVRVNRVICLIFIDFPWKDENEGVEWYAKIIKKCKSVLVF